PSRRRGTGCRADTTRPRAPGPSIAGVPDQSWQPPDPELAERSRPERPRELFFSLQVRHEDAAPAMLEPEIVHVQYPPSEADLRPDRSARGIERFLRHAELGDADGNDA